MKYFRTFGLLVVWQLFIITVSQASLSWLKLRSGDYLGGYQQAYLISPLYYSRANFDGNHYISIARDGYGTNIHYAYFPLYPNLIRLLAPYFATDYWAAITISIAAFTLAVFVLEKLIRLDYPAAVFNWTLYLILSFPLSFFFSFIYTESIFILFVISSFYFARTRHWWLAGTVGLLATHTRLVGMALFPALLFEYFRYQPHKKLTSLLPLFLIPCGLGIFIFYLYRVSGDPWAFIHSQQNFQQGRSEHFILIFQVFWRYLKMIFTVNRADPLYLAIILELATGVIFFTASIISFFRQRWSYAIYNFIVILLPPLMGNFTSLPRYILAAFPSFILFAEVLSRSSRVAKLAIINILVFLSIIYISLFVRGFWVA